MRSFAMPAAMQAAARLSPMNWSLEGLLAVVLRHGGLAEAAPWAMRLVLFGLLALVAGERLFRRRLT